MEDKMVFQYWSNMENIMVFQYWADMENRIVFQSWSNMENIVFFQYWSNIMKRRGRISIQREPSFKIDGMARLGMGNGYEVETGGGGSRAATNSGTPYPFATKL